MGSSAMGGRRSSQPVIVPVGCQLFRALFAGILMLGCYVSGVEAESVSSPLAWNGEWTLTLAAPPTSASVTLNLSADWLRALAVTEQPSTGGKPRWVGQLHVQARYQQEAGVDESPGSNGSLFRTDELWLQLSHQGNSFSTWLRLGRQRFQAGPVGLLVANPFDAIAAAQAGLSFPRWHLTLTGVDGRLDTSYVTYLPYVWDQDSYRWLRVQGPRAGLTWLVDGLGNEQGLSWDMHSAGPERSWVAEVALFRASRSADNYQGWVGAAVVSLDLAASERYKVNLNIGSVHPGFTPMASNLASAGGNLNFKNGSAGLELNTSWLARPQWLLENESSLLWRFGWLDAQTLFRFTQAWRPALQTVWELSWRPSSPIVTPQSPPDGRAQLAGQWQLRWQF